MDECVNCGDRATGTYSLVVPAGVLLEDKPLCETCRTLFQGSRSFEVHEAPVLLRGGNDEDDDEDARRLLTQDNDGG